ncbi:O-antigen/teichoic acid export membrane protein [Streptosporangium becharense]|uniref:O-antigen/teichoic acid export membrane protein n=1 Tax=Streptosporangium becharense TaxID=1816182 RepID=A0A7W9IHY2_9ACTN|nr:lipopolysaccharide biosynthesis protein [Streptosporangium becharense]MBB2913365.1 O-antigen/teichoic acid export membrane protein [Streptosporangium becharense]MBB5821055.1 O-antigen/teichoic acid export membrane protein [Streptosporangium becharense]
MAALTRLADLARRSGPAGRDGAAGLVGTGVGAVAQFLLVVVVTRGTPPESAGAFFAATSLGLTVAAILRLDTGNGLVHFIARSRPPRAFGAPGAAGVTDVADVADMAATSSCSDVVGVPETADTPGRPGVSGVPDVSGVHGVTDTPGPYRGGHRCPAGYVRATLPPVMVLSLVAAATALFTVSDPALRVLAAALPVLVCSDVVVSATRGFGTMLPTVLLDGVLQPTARLVLVGGAVLTGVTSVPVLAAAWVLPSLPVLSLAWLWLRRRLTRCPPGVSCTPDVSCTPGAARELWHHTWPRSLAAGIQAVFQRMDVVLVAALAGPAEAAVYTAATRFRVVGQLVGQGLARAAQPQLVRAMAEGDLPRVHALYRSSTRWLVLLTWPVWLGYAALAPWLLEAVFGGGYTSGAPVALVLATTMMLATGCGMADVVLTSAGHTRSSLAGLSSAVTTSVALDMLLVPELGALGAALGWAGGTAVKNLLPLWRIHRRYGLSPFGSVRRTVPASRGTP